MKRKKIIVGLLCLAIALSLVSCTRAESPGSDASPGSNASPDTSSTSPAEPVEITIANHQVPNSLCPLTDGAWHTFAVVFNVYDRLVNFDPVTFEWTPSIASSWEQVDEVTWNFEINLDNWFSNGDQLTMDDVIYSLERIKDFPGATTAAKTLESVSYEGTTLTMKFTNPYNTSLPQILNFGFIVNKNYVVNGGDDAIFLKPIGTGPYKVAEFTPGEVVRLELRDDYAYEKPGIDALTTIGIPETTSRYIALESGQIQFANMLSKDEYDLAMQDPSLTAMTMPSKRVMFFAFNCEREPFNDVNIRRALVHALDRKSCLELEGGRPGVDSILFPGTDYYYSSSKLPEYNLDKARELLEAAGYNESNPLHIDLIGVDPDPGVEMYQNTLRQLGVDMSVTYFEHSVYLTRERSGDFDMVWMANTTRITTFSDLDRVDAESIGIRNTGRFYTERSQELVEAMRLTNDPQEFKKMSIELNDILAENVPSVAVFLYPVYYAMDKRLEGVIVQPSMETIFRNAHWVE